MKVLVKDLKPNPFRDLKAYPPDKEKVKALIDSISETGFWDNILARRDNGHFQLAYGHARLEAIKELGIKEVDIPVREIDDATMLRIMANENFDTWRANTKVVIETVRAAKDFLDQELEKYESWEEVRGNRLITTLFENAGNFGSAKKEGIGQKSILKFLGPPWLQWHIQGALELMGGEENGKIDLDAIKEISSLSSARAVKDALSANQIPLKDQKKIINAIKSQSEENKENRKGPVIIRNISSFVEEEAFKLGIKKEPREGGDKDEFKKIFAAAEKLKKGCKDLCVDVGMFLGEAERKGINSWGGLDSWEWDDILKNLILKLSKLQKTIGGKK